MSLHNLLANISLPESKTPAKRPSKAWSAANRRQFDFARNSTAHTGELFIHDVIGIDDGGGGVTGAMFQGALRNLGDVREITVHINSPGGLMGDAQVIYNALVHHPARVITNVIGWACSAASFILQAGDERRIAELGTVMIHNVHGGAFGDHRTMIHSAGVFEKLTQQIADVYAKRSGRRSETFRSLMNDETWFTANEALEHRLVDKVLANRGSGQGSNQSREVAMRLQLLDLDNQIAVQQRVEGLGGTR